MAARLPVSLAFAAALLVAAPLAAQSQTAQQPHASTPPRDVRPTPQTGTAKIRGRITAADTHRPLRRARVTISAPELSGPPRTVSTDSNGRYEIGELPAGRFRITVNRSGYLTLQYGQRRPLEQGAVVQVAAGQTVDDVDFALPRMSVIAGRVTDEVGEPIAGVTVLALRSRYLNGKRQLVPSGNGLVQTDDTGLYRILGLAPGTYYVSASTRETWTENPDGAARVMGYAPTYYPGTTNSAEAGRITLGLGAEGAVDLSLITGRAATISGTAFDSRGRPFPNVVVREEIRGDGFARFGGAKNATVAADGTFSIREVTPGEYKLVASTRDTDHPEAAIVPITVDSIDLTDVVLAGSEGGSITGQVLTDTGAVPEIPRLLVNSGDPLIGQPDPTLLSVFRNPGFSPVAADGAFSIKGIFGRSPLRVTLPDDWMVKSIVHNGFDITDTPIELRSGEVMSDVLVTVTDRVTMISGQTIDEKGRPVSDATIVVFADDAEKWSFASRAVRAVRPDQQGRYQVKGLPTGDYLAIALEYVEDGLWNDPDFLDSLRRDAQKLALRDTTLQELPLKVVAPDKH